MGQDRNNVEVVRLIQSTIVQHVDRGERNDGREIACATLKRCRVSLWYRKGKRSGSRRCSDGYDNGSNLILAYLRSDRFIERAPFGIGLVKIEGFRLNRRKFKNSEYDCNYFIYFYF